MQFCVCHCVPVYHQFDTDHLYLERPDVVNGEHTINGLSDTNDSDGVACDIFVYIRILSTNTFVLAFLVFRFNVIWLPRP